VNDERLSRGEERFERWRRRIGLWSSVPLGLTVWLLGDDDPAQRLAAIMAFVAVLWITEAVPLPVTGLAAACLVVLTGVATPGETFPAFATPLLFVFIGSFFIAEAMQVNGLSERLARAAASVARTRLGVLVGLSGVAFFLSLWMSNTAATAVVLPIAVAVARTIPDRRFGAAVVLAIAYGASMGGIGTPIGTPPNLIGIAQLRQAGIELSFFQWMSVGLPLAVAMLAVLWLVLRLRFGVSGVLGRRVDADTSAWSRGEVAVAGILGLAIVLWLTPGVLALTGPASLAEALKGRLTEEVVAVGCATLLFVWPAGGGRPVLTWREATRIDWGTVLLFGAGILLGELARKTGLSARWGVAIVDATGADSLWAITAVMTAAAILLSEATSNTATATLMVPLAISLATAAQVSPLPPALGVTIGASFGFMLPISTAPNAMAYGTGRVTIRQMASAGIVFDVIGYLVVLGGLRLLCPLLGLD
jgi:sodium-dependent dicarboxylate transporter 2/3/5